VTCCSVTQEIWAEDHLSKTHGPRSVSDLGDFQILECLDRLHQIIPTPGT
jgi:hypothetical protein